MTDLPLERAIYDLSLEADVAAWGQDIAAIALSLLLIFALYDFGAGNRGGMTKTTGERVPPNDALTGSDGSFFRAVCAAAVSSNAARRMGLQIKTRLMDGFGGGIPLGSGVGTQ